MVRKLLGTVVGVALVLGWWTLRDKISGADNTPQAVDKIPAKVWEGGTLMTIDVDSSDPAVMRARFESTAKNGVDPLRSLDSYEKVAAGHHTWTIDVPDAVGGDLEFEATSPKTGSKLSWTVQYGDRTLSHLSDTLEHPVQGNEAFFLKMTLDDFSARE